VKDAEEISTPTMLARGRIDIDHVGRDGSFLGSWRVIEANSVGEIVSMTASRDGSLYYADVRNTCLRLMKLTPDGQISQVAGGNCTNLVASGDGGAAINATFKAVSGAVDLATGPDGAVYVANQSECRVRRIDPDGTINTVAGTICPAAEGHIGDGGPANAAKINPTSIAVRHLHALVRGCAHERRLGVCSRWQGPVRSTIQAPSPTLFFSAPSRARAPSDGFGRVRRQSSKVPSDGVRDFGPIRASYNARAATELGLAIHAL
jgi:hypothetical protein